MTKKRAKRAKGIKWDDQDKINLYKRYIEEGPQWYKFADEFGSTRHILRGLFRRTNWDKVLKENGISVQNLVEETGIDKNDKVKKITSVELRAQQLINDRQERLIKEADARRMSQHIDNIAKENLILDKIIAAITKVPFIEPEKVKREKFTSSPQEVCMMFSDAHVGLGVIPEEVGGLSHYNVDIFNERIKNYESKAIRITDLHRKTHEINTLHIPMLGDLVHGSNDVGAWGYLHQQQNVVDQVFEAFSAVVKMITNLSQIFDNIKIYGVYGNHGRIGQKGHEKKFVNWDYLIYKWMEASLSNYKNIEFFIPRANFQVQEIMNNKFLFCHGDGAKSWSGIPWYGLNRLEAKYRSMLDRSKEVGKLWDVMISKGIDQKSIKEQVEFTFNYVRSFDYMCFGHFHQMGEVETSAGGRMIMNASFVGGDDYSINDLISCSTPAQKIFGVNKHGRTWSYDIELDRK
ncbi:MAG TPA: metallophosphoesterase [Bacillota bacterium]|nr:metallophosphoesterase [Bacillota bacterium]